MIKQVMYEYLGTNGTILTPIHLEDVYYVRKIKLIAESGKSLTDGKRIEKSVLVQEEDVENWSEIDQGQE